MPSIGELNTRMQFHGMIPSEGPEAGEETGGVLYECWGGVTTVRMRDQEQAKTNGTLDDLTVFIRDTRGSFVPTNKQSVSILDPLFEGKMYNVKAVQPNVRDKRFIDIVLGLVS